MSDIKTRLSDGATLLEFEEGVRGNSPLHGLARQIVARELRDLELDILGDPGPLERLLVPVRPRRRPQRRG